MGNSPYFAPSYFPSSFCYGASTESSSSTGATPYYAPSYFPPSYFYDNAASATPSPLVSTTGVTPYFAPSYFPPSYFYGSPASSTPTPAGSSTFAMPYYPPSYFPPSYFYVSGALPTPTPPGTNPTEAVGRDQAAYAALMSLIRGLDVFDDVIFGAAIQRNHAGADRYPLALVTPKGWEESDDYDPTLLVRRVSFGITIMVRSQDGEPQFDQLDRLSTAILQVVDFSDLGGPCVAPLTRIRAGRYEFSSHYPEQSVELEGEFSSLIDPTVLASATN